MYNLFGGYQTKPTGRAKTRAYPLAERTFEEQGLLISRKPIKAAARKNTRKLQVAAEKAKRASEALLRERQREVNKIVKGAHQRHNKATRKAAAKATRKMREKE